jgi:hypothetical protein
MPTREATRTGYMQINFSVNAWWLPLTKPSLGFLHLISRQKNRINKHALAINMLKEGYRHALNALTILYYL